MVRSLLDLDFYKLTMAQLAFDKFRDLEVKWKFKNRSNVVISKILSVDTIKDELSKIRDMRFTVSDIQYLRELGMFTEDFLEFLSGLKLPKIKVKLDKTGEISITTKGYWCQTIFWETIVLSTINELYYSVKYPDFTPGKSDLDVIRKSAEKLDKSGVNWTDFGTRRRFSHDWQNSVLGICSEYKSFMGTSNVYFAKEMGLKPIGTNAHELYMVAAGVYDDDLIESQKIITDMWWDMYGYDLSIALTDTFGTEQFFKNSRNCLEWRGLRHDSGDPFTFGERAIEWYISNGYNPLTKTLVFSDGLDLDKILSIRERFGGRIGLSFGWGTKLTNNVGFETLSIVMKVVKVIRKSDEKLDRGLVKLSDNLNKAVGKKTDITRYKEVFGYTNVSSERLEV